VFEHVARKAGLVTTAGPNVRFAEAGKLMGLAAYGGPQTNWMRWFQPVDGAPRVTVSAYDIFLEIAALEKRYDNGEGKAYFRPWLVDLAHKVQQELEDALVHIVDVALEQTGLRHLCMAGGIALNSVANYHILRSCPLDDIFTFPAAGVITALLQGVPCGPTATSREGPSARVYAPQRSGELLPRRRAPRPSKATRIYWSWRNSSRKG
jgi:carbamoyltransferase